VICDEKARAGVDIVMVRMGSHPPTKAYVERRTAEGLSKPEIIRCLKRYVRRRSGARRGGSHRSVVWDRSGGRDFSSDAAVPIDLECDRLSLGAPVTDLCFCSIPC